MDNIRQLVVGALGMDPESIGTPNLDRLIRGHMKAMGNTSPEQYWRTLLLCPEVRTELLEQVVVNETWFFRDQPVFDAIAARARSLPHKPRILSLPCATGEEPYSVSMALLDAGVLGYEIIGLDISGQALQKAEQAVYGANSFRGECGSWRTRYFNATEQGWALSETVREPVTFASVNVALPNFLDQAAVGQFDVILFRNLSIYLDKDTRMGAFAQIHQHLVAGGMLCVAAAEAAQVPPHLFSHIEGPGLFQTVNERAPFVRKLPHPRKILHVPALEISPPPLSRPERPPIEGRLRSAREYANRGNLDEAVRVCQEIVASEGPNAEVYYLLALLASAGGDWEEHERQLRRVLYLDPNHCEALLQLALIADKAGNSSNAARLRTRARRVQAGAKLYD